MTPTQMIIFEEFKEAKKKYLRSVKNKKSDLFNFAYYLGYYHAVRLTAVMSGITLDELGE